MRRQLIGDLIELQRRRIDVDPLGTYEEIGVRSFGQGLFHKEPVDGIALGNKRVFEVQPGDLIFSNVFAWEGAVALAGPAEAGRCGSHRFMTYTAKTEDVDLGYLRYYFMSEPGLAALGVASPGSAGRNRTLAIERLEGLEISLPDPVEQGRVVATLDAVHGRVEDIRRGLERGALLMGALQVVAGRRPDIGETEKLRRGWTRIPLREILVPQQEETLVDLEISYPNVGILSFGRGLFEKPPIDGSRTSATKLFRIRAGQFIYSRLFAFEGAYAVVGKQFDGYFVSNEFPTFAVDTTRAHPDFLVACFRAPDVWQDLARHGKGLGVRRQRVSPDVILDHEIWLPPTAEQDQVAKTIALSDVCGKLRSQMKVRLGALTKATLRRQFGGPL